MSAPSLLGFLKRWWLLLVLGPVVAGAAGYYFVLRVPPVYQADTTLLVSRGSSSGIPGADDPTAAESLARTYAEALKTRPVLEEAARRTGVSLSGRELLQAVTVRPVTGTQLLRVVVEDRDPKVAADLANAIVGVFGAQNLEMQAGRFASSRQNLEQLVATLRSELDARSAELQQLRSTLAADDPQLTRRQSEFTQLQATYSDSVRTYENLRVAEASGLNGFTVVEPAVPATDPVRPNKAQSVAIAVLAGLVIAAATARAIEYLDDGLRTRERLAAATGLRALGSIPSWRTRPGGMLASQATASEPDRDARRAAESYRLLFGTLMIAGSDGGHQPRTLLVTSAAMDEGKSLTAANLAAVYAEAGRRVILVDADLHRPTQMERFGLPNRSGLSTLLLNQSVTVDSLLRETAVPGLRVVTSGPAPAAPSALYTSDRLAARLAELRSACDVLVFDTPPVLAQPDATLLGQHVDGVVFVVDARKSRGRQVRRALELLNEAGVVVLGAAFNRVPPRGMDYVPYTAAQPGPVQSEDSTSSGAGVTARARGRAT